MSHTHGNRDYGPTSIGLFNLCCGMVTGEYSNDDEGLLAIRRKALAIYQRWPGSSVRALLDDLLDLRPHWHEDEESDEAGVMAFFRDLQEDKAFTKAPDGLFVKMSSRQFMRQYIPIPRRLLNDAERKDGL